MALDWHDYLPDFIRCLDATGCLSSEWLKDALHAVPRHCFIEQYLPGDQQLVEVGPEGPTDEQFKLIYSDSVLQIRPISNHSAASQPSLIMLMLADLDLKPGQKVLEIGTGSGWNTGLLAFGVRDGRLIHSIDIQSDLVEAAQAHLQAAGIDGVNLTSGDGGHGWVQAALFDRIVATVGCPDIPPAWHEQLAEGGMLLTPLKVGFGDPVLRLLKCGERMIGGFTRWSWFMTLQGDFWTQTWDRVEGKPESWIGQLLATDPIVVALSEAVNAEFLFFLHLKGLGLQALSGAGYLHRESGSVLAADSEPPQVRIYGKPILARKVRAYQQGWIRLGRPQITDYTVELLDSDSSRRTGQGWLDRRASACLWFTLNKSA